MHLPKHAAAALEAITVLSPMDSKTAQANTETTLIAFIPAPVLCILLTAVLIADEQVKHEKSLPTVAIFSPVFFRASNRIRILAWEEIAKASEFPKMRQLSK